MDAPAKQQVVERVRQANNILVTVSVNPSLDQLSACIGLTLMLNKMGKHATAVFSGKVPAMLDFLEPKKTIETNTDSLQDFIISLDKSKADKLRYKVEDKVVKIFITPYRTSLSENDLEFSMGDFNVDVVMALGIKDKTQIDAAITAHGRILHDATVVSINAGEGKAPELGQINWQDQAASSLSEMLVSISEALGTGLIDNQMANAFLTGIVSETQRFSNKKTSPKVMTMSAQLMAAGANQQLIVSKLEPPQPPPLVPAIPGLKTPGPELITRPVDGTLNVAGGGPSADNQEVEVDPKEISIDEQGNMKRLNELKAAKEAAEAAAKASPPPPPADILPQATVPPTEATAEKSEDKTDEKPIGPHTLLDPKSYRSSLGTSFTANTQPEGQDPADVAPIDPLGQPEEQAGGFLDHTASVQPPSQVSGNDMPGPTLDSARSAVDEALSQAPFDPSTAGPINALNAQSALDSVNNETPGHNNAIAPPPGPPPITFEPGSLDQNNPSK